MGEIWGDARAWLGGEHFDGVMNYRVAWSCLGWVADGRLQHGHAREAIPYGCLSGERWKEVILETLSWYRPDVNQAQLNLLDSHDVPRALHMLQGDVEALKLALVLLFVLPGVPCVYYGTEVGLSGGEEPGCREAFPWGDPQAWPHDLRAFIASLAALRRELPALRSAELAVEVLQGRDGDQGLRLVRGAPGGDQVEVVINRSRRVGLEVAGLEECRLLWAFSAGQASPRPPLTARGAWALQMPLRPLN